jgi:predicted dinucleotide-binding enzyme
LVENESAGEILSALLPKDARLAKALGTLGAASLANAAFQKPANVLFYATDDTGINKTIEELIQDNGFEPLCIGSIDQSISFMKYLETCMSLACWVKQLLQKKAKENLKHLISGDMLIIINE